MGRHLMPIRLEFTSGSRPEVEAVVKVLVTGGDGFIGSHVSEELLRGGHEVTAYMLYNSFGTAAWLDRPESPWV